MVAPTSPMTLDRAKIASAYRPPAAGKMAKKKSIDPATIDLGMNPHFSTVQYQVPSGRGPLSNNPIYTALNFGAKT